MTAFNRINDLLFVGGDPVYSTSLDEDIAVLNAQVDLIIDCRSKGEVGHESDWGNLENLDVPVLHIPMYDDLRNDNSPQDFLNAKAIVERDYPNAKSFFIHCHMGVNRGPSMALFFLIDVFGMSAKAGFELLRELRPGCGIAYAEQAVAAALTLADGQVDADINKWIQFEDDYWTPEALESVKNRIMKNRYGPSARVVVDARGVEHVMAPAGGMR